ncbi:MAG: hypothetical protein K5945_10905 [Bacteroidaceae bacterium]|nr:hypothetical protein [Bacteroidaceae bacterium]
MKTTEMVMDFLKKEGFCPKVDEDNGNIVFKYQMCTFLFINNDEDEEFFQLAFPGIYDVTEENRDIALEAANKVNSSIKVAKVIVPGENVWVLFEVILDQSPEVGNIIERGLSILQAARKTFYDELQ